MSTYRNQMISYFIIFENQKKPLKEDFKLINNWFLKKLILPNAYFNEFIENDDFSEYLI